MTHTSDFDLTERDITGLGSVDAITSFLNRLGYNTSGRAMLTPEAIGLFGDSASALKQIELLSEDAEGFLRVVFAQPRSLTAKVRNELARTLGKSTVDHLLIMTPDFESFEIVLLDKRRREAKRPAAIDRVQVVPKTISFDRRCPSRLDLRILRRLTWTYDDAFDQFDKLKNVFEAAVFTGEYFQNRGLFSDYFLRERLREDPAWSDNPAEMFAFTRELLGGAQRRWRDKGEAAVRQELYEPLFDQLGFKHKALKSAKDSRTKPDYILTPKAGGGKTAAFVYAWDRWLDGPDFNSDRDTSEENPGACVVTALDEGIADWVIVTNGRQWRLYSRQAHSRATNFYEVDLVEALVASGDTDPNEAFRYWWLFFRSQAFHPAATEKTECWLDTIAQGSRDYSKRLGERLKHRVFLEIFPHLAKGFLEDRRRRLGIRRRPTEEELHDIFEATLTLLYRLLFLLYAEARDLLPIREGPYRAASLKKIKEQVAESGGVAESEAPERITKAYSARNTAIYDHLARLCRAMDKGDPELNVPIYNGGLFITEADESQTREQRIARFLAKHKVPDRQLALAIDRLARDPDEKTLAQVFIDYKSLEVRHLGSIYEGLLEFKLKVTDEDLTTKTEQKKEKYIPLSKAKAKRGHQPSTVVKKGGVYLSNDKAERKASGSYYTPDPIVEYIVEHTVAPVLDEKLEHLRPQFRKVRKTFDNEVQKAEAYPSKKPSGESWEPRDLAAEKTYLNHRGLVEELFDFRVLDPAMGSGHFLVAAVDLITDRILTFLNQFPVNPVTFMLERTRRNIVDALGEQGVEVDPANLTEVNLLKRHVLKRCIYGVDLTPMAVELAKVSLWLDAFTIGAPLSFLDHHLRCGNSLIGANFDDLKHATQEQLFGIDYEPLLRAIRHVLQVNKMADATAAEVKKSADEYDAAREELSGYQVVLDLLVARHFGLREAVGLLEFGDELELSSRADFLDTLAAAAPSKEGEKPALQLVEEVTALARRRDLCFFHWEIEFPEVFFDFEDTEERRIKHKNEIAKGTAGFDAVVGNPPYDVLAEKELGVDLKDLLAYFREMKTLRAAIKGKQNLYKLFICRGVDLGRQGAHVGHIVPMPLLGDEQAAGVRRMLFSKASFRLIEAFPQKDDARHRVFGDAKLSTCVFVVRRAHDESPFRCRVHPGKEICEDSPSLLMRRSDPVLYDPENQPIVSCSQEDWDLATRIMRSGRMKRLGDFCEAFQGEVNETVNRRKGNLSSSAADGQQVLRGSNICLYVLREASQGEPFYLRKDKYLADKREGTKAWHHLQRRVGVQESSPQNNFRRVIAALIPEGQFCNHKINYFPGSAAQYSLEVVLCILNSRLSDWYFRLGSTNASVSHYQLYTLPCPVFATDAVDEDRATKFGQLITLESEKARRFLVSGLAKPPFPSWVAASIVTTVREIISIEQRRGKITRAERSALSPEAQKLQDLLDQIIYRMAGLSEEEAEGLERRLAKML